MSKAFWVSLGLLLLAVCIVFSLIFFAFLNTAEQQTDKLHTEINKTLEECGAFNTTFGLNASRFIEQGFDILDAIFGMLKVAFVLSLLVFIVEVIIWYAAKRL